VDVVQGVEVAVRGVTADEIATYDERGWVKLPGLVDAADTARLLERAKQRLGERGDATEYREGLDRATYWHDYAAISKEDDLFGALACSPTMGRNAALLIGRDTAMRHLYDTLAVKLPADLDTKSPGTRATDWHQDGPTKPFDRLVITLWVALDTVTPEHGSMRFYDGSQRFGPLGALHVQHRNPDLLLRTWPQVTERPLSEPLHYEPGDATAHSPLVVHGAPQNTTDRPRWAFIAQYVPADALYTGMASFMTDGLGLEPWQPVDHPKFPLVYDPTS
jgi:hypothetical protein